MTPQPTLRPAGCRRVENRSGRPGRRVVSRGADRNQGQRLARGSRPPGRAAVSPRSKGRPRRRRSRAPAVSQRHPPYHPQPGGRCRHRGPGIRSQSPGWGRAIAGSRRGLACRDADGGQVAVAGDAGPLCTGPVGCTGRRGPRPLRSRIKRCRYWGWGCRRYRWKQRGKERQKGLYWEFIQKLEGAHGPRARGFRNFQMSTVRHLANIRPLSLPAPRPVSGSSQGMHALGAVRLSRASSSASTRREALEAHALARKDDPARDSRGRLHLRRRLSDRRYR